GGAGGPDLGPDPRRDRRYGRGPELRSFVLTGRSFVLLGAAGMLYVFAFVVPALALAGVALDGLVLALAVIDARRASRLPFTVARSLPATMHQGEPAPASIALANLGSRPLDVTIRETLSPLLLERPLRTARILPPRSRVNESAPIVPLRRGQDVLAGATARVA